LEQARALVELCRRYGVPLIVNDDLELAAEAGADGLHLGQNDADLTVARARLGASAIIGISCCNSLEYARQAVLAGADYLAFGRFFPSSSKPQAVQASIELLRQARREFSLPLVAIGGITPANGGDLLAAGADFLAVIYGLFGQPDIGAAARAYTRLFS
jgi:thiamine-phosphate pyrophosphorylase